MQERCRHKEKPIRARLCACRMGFDDVDVPLLLDLLEVSVQQTLESLAVSCLVLLSLLLLAAAGNGQ